MQGIILEYNETTKIGIIRASDEKKYRFSKSNVKSTNSPYVNASVDFEPYDNDAIEIYILSTNTMNEIRKLATASVEPAKNISALIANLAFVLAFMCLICIPCNMYFYGDSIMECDCIINIAWAIGLAILGIALKSQSNSK